MADSKPPAGDEDDDKASEPDNDKDDVPAGAASLPREMQERAAQVAHRGQGHAGRRRRS